MAYAFLFVEVEEQPVRTIMFDLLIVVTSIVRRALALRRRVEKIVGVAALIIDIRRIGHLYDDR